MRMPWAVNHAIARVHHATAVAAVSSVRTSLQARREWSSMAVWT